MTGKTAPGWKKGTSGNPKGRPKGSRNQATLLAMAAMEGELNNVVRVVINAAKGGDMASARLVIDKLVPAVRERPISIDLPDLNDSTDCASAQGAVIRAVASGALLPGEGEALSSLIENRRRGIETADIAKRLETIEEMLKGKL